MAMQTWTATKTKRDPSARSQYTKEANAAKYLVRVARKSELVVAYRLGFASTVADYSETHRERRGLSDKQLEQFYAGWYAKYNGLDSEF